MSTSIGTIASNDDTSETMRSPSPLLSVSNQLPSDCWWTGANSPRVHATVSVSQDFQDDDKRRRKERDLSHREGTGRRRMTFDPPSFTALPAKRARRGVSFEKVVRVRNISPASPGDKKRKWISNEELAEFKTSAKMMCKRHCLLRSISRTQTKLPTVEEAIRFSVNSGQDSLRGLEHLTSVSRFVERATRLRETNEAVCQSQQEQLLNQALHSVSKNDPQTEGFLDFTLDHSKLARAYREKCRGAIEYSLRVAQEDARVAKSFLETDCT